MRLCAVALPLAGKALLDALLRDMRNEANALSGSILRTNTLFQEKSVSQTSNVNSLTRLLRVLRQYLLVELEHTLNPSMDPVETCIFPSECQDGQLHARTKKPLVGMHALASLA